MHCRVERILRSLKIRATDSIAVSISDARERAAYNDNAMETRLQAAVNATFTTGMYALRDLNDGFLDASLRKK